MDDATNAIPPSEIVVLMQPQTDAHRPPAFPYALSRLADLPRRLFRPPPPMQSGPASAYSLSHAQARTSGRTQGRTSTSSNGSWVCFGTRDGGYGRVRSFTLTPSFSVSVDDVLNGRLLPPLTATEFQDYLIFVEQSVENLIFHRWFNDYERVYSRLFPATTESGDSLPPALTGHDRTKAVQRLHLSYLRAKQTFLTPRSPYELNLDQAELEELNAALVASKRDSSIDPSPNPQQTQAQPSRGCDRPPHPSLFAGIHKRVKEMLSDSLHRYITLNSGNAGRNRGIFAIVLGILIMAVGIIPELYSYSMLPGSNDRWIRFTAFAPFWVGCLTLVMGLHGVCIVIFCLGDARQLCPYELARPTISAPLDTTKTSDRNDSRKDGEKDSMYGESSAAGSMKHNAFPSAPPSLKYNSHAEKTQADLTPRPHPVSLQSLPCSSGEIDTKNGVHGSQGAGDTKEADVKAYHIPNILSSPFWTVDFDSIFPLEAMYMGSVASSSKFAGSSSASGSGTRQNPSSSDTVHETNQQVEGTPTPSQARPLPPLSHQTHPIRPPLILPIPHQSVHDSRAATTLPSPPPRPSPAQSLSEGRALFAPLTRVLEPLILRSQWEITMRSALLSFLVAGVITGTLVAVP